MLPRRGFPNENTEARDGQHEGKQSAFGCKQDDATLPIGHGSAVPAAAGRCHAAGGGVLGSGLASRALMMMLWRGECEKNKPAEPAVCIQWLWNLLWPAKTEVFLNTLRVD